MKFHEPRFISLVNATLITALYLVFFLIGVWIIRPEAMETLFVAIFLPVSVISLFLLSFLLFRFTVEKFIYSKIRLIYKSIHNIKTKKGDFRQPKIDNQFLDQVGEEVAVWQQEKTREIEQLKQLELYRRDFIGNLAHELKTPLFNIQGYVLTLLDGALDDPAINTEYLKRTEKSIERLIRIVEDLDEITQFESGQIKLKINKFDLLALTNEVIEMLDMKAKKEGIKLVCHRHDKPVMVDGDRERIRQVLTNIIENSIRYGNPGGKTKISFFDMDENILTEVTDDGIGMDPEDIPRVFERFYRTTRGRASFQKGKGLGLAIVKHIMEAHNQTVSVRSAVGVGTTVGFTLRKSKSSG